MRDSERNSTKKKLLRKNRSKKFLDSLNSKLLSFSHKRAKVFRVSKKRNLPDATVPYVTSHFINILCTTNFCAIHQKNMKWKFINIKSTCRLTMEHNSHPQFIWKSSFQAHIQFICNLLSFHVALDCSTQQSSLFSEEWIAWMLLPLR